VSVAKAAAKPEIKRMNMHIEAGLHDAFKAATAAQGKKMTDVLLDFIHKYVKEHLPAALPRKGGRP
jgi:oligoribonuclease (3'-5' exoribonuclease)